MTMKIAVLSGVVLLAAFILPGCPVYPRDQACFHDEDCPSGSLCYSDGYCAPSGQGGSGSISTCDEPKDCRPNETCGTDARCHVGSCQFHGCVAGFSCGRADGVWECLRSSSTGGRGGRGGTGGSYGGGDADVSDSGDSGSVDGMIGAGGNDAQADVEPDADAAGSGGTNDAAGD
jgi:hypothetical protein